MLYKSNFKKDLSKSIVAEEYTVDKLKPTYPKAHRIEGNHKEFDIMIPEVEETIEVKLDELADKTGNVFIEFQSRNEPSGIETTTADWWFIYIKKDLSKCIRIKTDELRQLIKDKTFRIVPGGDENTSMGYLIKVEDIEK